MEQAIRLIYFSVAIVNDTGSKYLQMKHKIQRKTHVIPSAFGLRPTVD